MLVRGFQEFPVHPPRSLPIEALETALAAHGDQAYGAHPYGFHLRGVMEMTARLGFRTERHLAVAALHDVLEDTELGEDALAQRFGREIATAVRQLSRDSAVPEERYISSMGELAFSVKLGDRLSNLSNMGTQPEGPATLRRLRERTLPKYQGEQVLLEQRARGTPSFERACARIRAELDQAQCRLDLAERRAGLQRLLCLSPG